MTHVPGNADAAGDPYPNTRIYQFDDGWCEVLDRDGHALSATMPTLGHAYAYQAGVEAGLRMAARRAEERPAQP